MNKVMRLVEADMKMEQVLQSFMVDLDVDSKNAVWLDRHWTCASKFLSQNPHINNRLACLVREVMELPYLKVVLVAFACLGKTYTEEVLNSVSDVAAEHLDEVKKLTDLMLPHLKTVLARQRRDYGIDEETFPMDYPVSEQASNIDGTPVHNIGMERQCGKVDYRLKKLGTLNAVSRSIILQKSQELRNGQVPSFRGFKAAAQAKREVELKD
ncbi:Hypothetical protein FKW44_011728 [Caligus rogercresseyi]|uniref:Uncharacterized protein n=1 Tax=Caligus rogercresseyi TaxID=217165 RepID=A0A7T8HIC2_CALRO|nr:Hypothetical protein FKW44_011728 [Caligus rogercresseyi]